MNDPVIRPIPLDQISVSQWGLAARFNHVARRL